MDLTEKLDYPDAFYGIINTITKQITMSTMTTNSPRYPGPLTTFVIADSKSMEDLHPSGLSKTDFAREKMKILFENSREPNEDDQYNCYFSIVHYYGREGDVSVELWPTRAEFLSGEAMNFPSFSPNVPPSMACGIEAALEITKVYTRLRLVHEPWSRIVLITDGQDMEPQKTKQLIDSLWAQNIAFFIYYLPTKGDSLMTGYEYCASIGHTHKWIIDRGQLAIPLSYEDMGYTLLDDWFTGYRL